MTVHFLSSSARGIDCGGRKGLCAIDSNGRCMYEATVTLDKEPDTGSGGSDMSPYLM